MAKIYFFAFLALLVFAAVSAQEEEAVPSDQLENVEPYWSCQHGGNAACSASCVLHKRFLGGHCNSEGTCICN